MLNPTVSALLVISAYSSGVKKRPQVYQNGLGAFSLPLKAIIRAFLLSAFQPFNCMGIFGCPLPCPALPDRIKLGTGK